MVGYRYWSIVEGLVLVLPLKIGNIFACFNKDGNCPAAKLLLIRAAIDDGKQFTASFSSHGPSPSSHLALEGSILYVS